MRRVVHALGILFSLTAATGCRLQFPREDLRPEDIETAVFLIGDAGEPDPRHPEAALDSLTAQAAVIPDRSIIVFLGDNVYPDGIPEEGRAESADARRRLQSQVLAVPRGARGIFVPGNHDWADMGPFGLYSVRLQERLITSLAEGRDVRMLPGNGCPGPVPVDAGRLRLVAMDTQWWLHDYIVRDSESRCETRPAAVTAALRNLLRTTPEDRVVVVMGHHPLMTGGEHGGYCSIKGPFHRLGGRSQDILSNKNRAMRDSLESSFAARPPLAYAAGHEHNLQVLRGGPNVPYLLVSGAGAQSKVACAVKLRESFFVSQHRSGFMRLDVMRGKGVLLRVFHYKGGGRGGLAYSQWLEPR